LLITEFKRNVRHQTPSPRDSIVCNSAGSRTRGQVPPAQRIPQRQIETQFDTFEEFEFEKGQEGWLLPNSKFVIASEAKQSGMMDNAVKKSKLT
jgi:hypothetical protein